MLSDTKEHPIEPRTLTGYITAMDDVALDVRALFVELENKEILDFKAGQYAFLQLGDLEGKPYSIASVPGDKTVSFHIKNTGYGVSAYVADQLKLGDEVKITAPFGEHYLQLSDRPILAIAGGLGIAPIKSIIEMSLKTQPTTPVHLYYGANKASDLYLEQHFVNLGKKYSPLHFIPVVNEGDTNGYKTGKVGQVALNDFDDLSMFDAYVSGPLKMAEAVINALLDKNMPLDHIHSDALQVLKFNKK